MRQAEMRLSANEARKNELVCRADKFASIDMSRVPLYSVTALATALQLLQRHSEPSLTAAKLTLGNARNEPVELDRYLCA